MLIFIDGDIAARLRFLHQTVAFAFECFLEPVAMQPASA